MLLFYYVFSDPMYNNGAHPGHTFVFVTAIDGKDYAVCSCNWIREFTN